MLSENQSLMLLNLCVLLKYTGKLVCTATYSYALFTQAEVKL